MNRLAFKPLWLIAIVLAAGPSGCGRGGERAGMVHIAGDDGGFHIDRFEYPNRAGEIPRHETTLQGAADACAAEDKRLCTDAEWRRACSGPGGDRRYGYGDSYEDGRCFAGVRPASGHSGMPNEADVLVAAGSYDRCATPEGVHDMVGNVEEWVLSNWQAGEGALEGGASFTASWYASCDGRYSRQPHYRLDTREAIFSAGFRCCWSEGAPTAADLTADDLAADTRDRMAAARAGASGGPYRAEDEVEIATGLFVDRHEYPNRPGERPLVGIPWTEASELCGQAGKRLCTVVEWERACAGLAGRSYPYGDTFQPDGCAVQVVDPVPAGTFSGCLTPEGAADLVGGAWEWTGSEMARPEGLFAGAAALREVRGGSWFADAMDGVCRPRLGYTAAPQDAAFPDVGFRCCRGSLPAADPALRSPSVACPEDMAPVGEGCIDRHEYPNRAGTLPAWQLDLAAATAACAGVGKHLCKESEWVEACGGTARRRWPYGETLATDACNLIKGEAGMGDRRAASGSFPDCVSPQGVHDLSGNLWEWVSTDAEGGVLLGGGWISTAGFGACDTRAEADPSYRTAQTGARCCASAAEARLLLAGPSP